MLNIKLAHSIFGISVVALGIQLFILDHITVTKPPAMSFLGGSFLLIGFLYKIGVITFATAILFNYKIKSAAFSLGVLIFIWTLIRHFPLVIANITDPAELNSMFMAVAASGSSFIMAGSIQARSSSYPTYLIVNRHIEKLIGNFFYGMAIIVFGIQHILYASFIASLIPSWIPGGDVWSYGTGLALITAGVSITAEWKSKNSALWLGIMISLWIVIVNLPRVYANPRDYYEWTGLFQAIIIATSAFVLRKNLSFVSRAKEAIRHKDLARPWQAKKHGHQRHPATKRI